MRNGALEAVIAEAPDELDGLAVYSDWLSERGEPHGALIAIHLRRHASPGEPPSAADLVEEARLTPLVFDLKRVELPVVRYTVRFGFLHELTLSGGGKHAGPVLRRILAHRTAPFLRSIVVEAAPRDVLAATSRAATRRSKPSPEDLDERATTTSVWAALRDVGLPRTLRTASLPPPLGHDVTDAMQALAPVEELTWPLRSLGLLEAHRGRLPALRTLTLTPARLGSVDGSRVQAIVDAFALAPGLASLPEIRLSTRVGGLVPDEIAALAEHLPRLRVVPA